MNRTLLTASKRRPRTTGWPRGIFGAAEELPRQRYPALSFLARVFGVIVGPVKGSSVTDGNLYPVETPLSFLVTPTGGAFDSNLADIVEFAKHKKGSS